MVMLWGNCFDGSQAPDLLGLCMQPFVAVRGETSCLNAGWVSKPGRRVRELFQLTVFIKAADTESDKPKSGWSQMWIVQEN